MNARGHRTHVQWILICAIAGAIALYEFMHVIGAFLE